MARHQPRPIADWQDREYDADRHTDPLRNAMIANAFLAAALAAFASYQRYAYNALDPAYAAHRALSTGSNILAAAAFVAMLSLAAIRTIRDIRRRN